MVVDETVQEEAADCEHPIAKHRRALTRKEENGRNGEAPAEQVGNLDWSPCSFPYITPLAVETRDPIPGNNGV